MPRSRVDARRAAKRGRTVGEALADPIAVVRVQWNGRFSDVPIRRYNVHAYTARHQRIPLDQATQQTYLTGLMQHWPTADWWGDSDSHRRRPAAASAAPVRARRDTRARRHVGPAHTIPTTIGAPA